MRGRPGGRRPPPLRAGDRAARAGAAEPALWLRYPAISPDGSRIAFASDRNGNFDVFVMPAAGGEATRLTFHPADEFPSSFTPDGGHVLFGGTVLDASASVQFPAGCCPSCTPPTSRAACPSRR